MENLTIQGRYKIIRQIGSGGFGLTFLAEDLHLPNRPQCVVKQLHSQFPDENARQIAARFFHQEAETLYNLGNHPKIPSLIAHFEENGEFFLVQELIEGWTLAQEFTGNKIYNEKEAVDLLTQILETLVFVHSRNVIHRDIKPTNLIRRKSDGSIFLIDFGAVKQVTVNPNNQNPTFKSTIAIGSSGYMPPEQTVGKPRFASDLYAAGLVTIEALTGLNPLKLGQNATSGEFVWQHKTRINADFSNFLTKLVRYDFRQRYNSANEAFAALNMIALSAGVKRRDQISFNSPPPMRNIQPLIYKPQPLPKPSEKPLIQTTVAANPVQQRTLAQPFPRNFSTASGNENNQNNSNSDFKIFAGVVSAVLGLFLVAGFMVFATTNFGTTKEVAGAATVKTYDSKPSPAYQEGLNQGEEAAIKEKKATTKFEWEEVGSQYKRAAQMLDSIKPYSAEYEKAQTKSAEFNQKSQDALAKSQDIGLLTQSSTTSQLQTTPNPTYSNYYTQQTSTPAPTPIKKAKMPGRQKNKMYISFSSSTGDYIGQGKDTVITDVYGNFSMRLNSRNRINIHYSGATFWSLDLEAPQNGRLTTGTYNGAQRSPDAARPGLDFSGDGRGCNQLKGSFTINNIVYSADEAEVLLLDATFVQYCEGGSASLMGRVYIDSRY